MDANPTPAARRRSRRARAGQLVLASMVLTFATGIAAAAAAGSEGTHEHLAAVHILCAVLMGGTVGWHLKLIWPTYQGLRRAADTSYPGERAERPRQPR